MKKRIGLLLVLVMILSGLTAILPVGAEELPPYDYKGFVGDWRCYVQGHTEGTSGTQWISIVDAADDAVCITVNTNPYYAVEGAWYPIEENTVWIEDDWVQGLASYHNADVYAARLIFCDDSINVRLYAKTRPLPGEGSRKFDVEYWFTSPNAVPRRYTPDGISLPIGEEISSSEIEYYLEGIYIDERAEVPALIQKGISAQSYGLAGWVIDGRTVLPVRFVTEALGCQVEWFADTRQVVVNAPDGRYCRMTLGSNLVETEAGGTALDVSVRTWQGSTMVPARFLGEWLGKEVLWEEITRSVFFDSPRQYQAVAQEAEKIAGNALAYAENYYQEDFQRGHISVLAFDEDEGIYLVSVLWPDGSWACTVEVEADGSINGFHEADERLSEKARRMGRW